MVPQLDRAAPRPRFDAEVVHRQGAILQIAILWGSVARDLEASV
jgi:hypothetical protein